MLALIGAGIAAPRAAENLPIRAVRWIAQSSDLVRVLLFKPSECFAKPKDAEAAYLAGIGRAAFSTPLVLGGQAARAGLSCESCHRGARTNADFLFPGLSGAPGTADVTTALLSSHRGDGIDNPKPIPDLGGPPAALKVSRDPAKPDLENFIHGIITEEFDGAEPPPPVLKGLAAYVRALSPEACPAQALQPITVKSVMADAARAMSTANAALRHGDNDTAIVMLSGARAQLGLLNERFALSALKADQAALAASDLYIASIIEAVRANPKEAPGKITVWDVESGNLEQQLSKDEGKSLFDKKILAAALARN